MKNYADPTSEELHEWAYNPQSEPPIQDWELFLSKALTGERAIQVFNFIEDHSCPQRGFFINLLYFTIDHSFSHIDPENIGTISYFESLVRTARKFNDPEIKRWRYLAHLVIQNPETFNRKEWGPRDI